MSASRIFGIVCIASALVAGAVAFLPSAGSTVIVPDPPPPVPGAPERLLVPKIGVDAPVEPVTLDPRGDLGIPGSYDGVGWYALGPKPGESGAAVIDGHLTRHDLSPAVFGRLRELVPGDEIEVVASGTERTFRVVRLAVFPYDAEPPPEVFATSGPPRLNLITCEGRWDQSKRVFTERLVVFAE